MKTLKSLFTELMVVVDSKTAQQQQTHSTKRRRSYESREIVESEDVSSRPVCCVDDYFSTSPAASASAEFSVDRSASSSSRGRQSQSHKIQKKNQLTVSIVDNLSLKDLIDLKGPENLNASDLCLFAKTKKILEEEHKRVQEKEALMRQMRDKVFTGYKWPAHLDGINDERYQTLYQWFKTYCCLTTINHNNDPHALVKEGDDIFSNNNSAEEEAPATNNICKDDSVLKRKKGLILFSKERRLGKSRFATGLVEDNPNWYIHCKGNFNKEAFIKKPEAKLLIIDDFVYQESKHREIFKALISSEPTTIREAYMNYQFDHGLPTIICTNDEKFVKMASKSIYFKNDAYFTRIKEYMGPPNSNPYPGDNFSADDVVHGNKDFWEYFEEEECSNNNGSSDSDRNTLSLNNLFHQQQQLLSGFSYRPNNNTSSRSRRELSPPLMSRLVSVATASKNPTNVSAVVNNVSSVRSSKEE
jgi:hypothetical protein